MLLKTFLSLMNYGHINEIGWWRFEIPNHKIFFITIYFLVSIFLKIYAWLPYLTHL